MNIHNTILKKWFPVFYDYNGNIFCHECFYKSENNLCDPYILIESKNNVKCLFPFTYESSNINILFTGENRGLRGEKSQFNIFIENNKRNALYELDILIEVFYYAFFRMITHKLFYIFFFSTIFFKTKQDFSDFFLAFSW